MYWRYGLLVSKNLKHDFLNDHFWIFDDHLQWHGIWNYLGLLAQHISFLLNHWWTVSNIKSVQFGHKWTYNKCTWDGITIDNPIVTHMRTSINLVVTRPIYNSGIVISNLLCTYSQLVPKWDTFLLLEVHLCTK